MACFQIAKTIRSILIRHPSNAKVSDRCLIDVDGMFIVICVSVPNGQLCHCVSVLFYFSFALLPLHHLFVKKEASPSANCCFV